MSQKTVVFEGSSPSGAVLLDEQLTGFQENVNSNHIGKVRPSYIQIGGSWIDNSIEGKYVIKYFDGVNDLIMGELNLTTLKFTPTDSFYKFASSSDIITGTATDKMVNVKQLVDLIGLPNYNSSKTYALGDWVRSKLGNDYTIFESLSENNSNPLTETANWKSVSLGSSGGGYIGQITMGARTDVPEGQLRMDGSSYPYSAYPTFVSEYLKANKIPVKSLAEYELELTNNNGNCGFFGVDDVGQTFRVPILKDSVFVSQALLTGNIASFVEQSLPNAEGNFRGTANTTTNGPFTVVSSNRGGGGDWGNATSVDFSLSTANPIYQDGADVLPHHIMYPLFITVSNVAVPASEVEYNQFINGLTSRMDTDLSNVSQTGVETSIGWGMPDYSSYIQYSKDVDVILEEDSFVTIRTTSGTSYLYIDDVNVWYHQVSGTWYSDCSPIKIAKGSKIKISGSTSYMRVYKVRGGN